MQSAIPMQTLELKQVIYPDTKTFGEVVVSPEINFVPLAVLFRLSRKRAEEDKSANFTHWNGQRRAKNISEERDISGEGGKNFSSRTGRKNMKEGRLEIRRRLGQAEVEEGISGVLESWLASAGGERQ
ncbi:predicted protein [Histoplasma capsulatum H143]|uniref:Uncharacterized protein n=1 Tax=Ajellomyces capsulatus (strain H143) TaxID=544712 RepID=C6HMT4_AJECH|nr:predicted protein [Histoplasma capsulatum H143]